MKIDLFWIGKYKNLTDVTIDFDENNWVTVVLGRNGTGKSNVLEALATLFRDLIMDKDLASFEYKISYQIKNKFITIFAKPSEKQKYKIFVSDKELNENKLKLFNDEYNYGEEIKVSQFKKDKEKYLPNYIFGYYSGHSPRMEEVFRDYLAQYDKKLRNNEDPGLRKMFYALPVHSQFVLLSFILQQDDIVKEFLNDHLGLDPENGIDSVLFVIKEPDWAKNKNKKGYDKFWHAEGIVKEFLDELYKIALAPIRIKRQEEVSLWNKKTKEYVYLYVKDLISLETLASKKQPRDFFKDLESTYVSEMIDEVRIRVKLKKNDGTVIFKELSEGEQQLLTVLGLLRFTKEEESLFLLDEPDTHLNPRWSVKYLEYLKKFINANENEEINNSHIILTTHNPMAIAELKKEQVQILTRDDDTLKINASMPDIDPRGLGFAGILTSEMFGLESTLDSKTFNLLEEKRIITLKEEPLNLAERERLKEINLLLEKYDLNYETRDPDFSEFLKHKYKKEKK